MAFSKPRYCKVNRIPRVPTEDKINLILGHASRKYVIIYKLAMECGLRPVELGSLTMNDIDSDKGAISFVSAKHGNPRMLKLENETLALLTNYIKINDKEEFHSATANSVSEAAKLVEQDFDFVTDIDRMKLFRKRK